MLDSFNKLREIIKQENKSYNQEKFNKIIHDYSFHHVSNLYDIDQKLFEHIENSKIIIINQYQFPNQNSYSKYLIIGFQKTIILIESKSISLLSSLFKRISELKICFLPNSKDIFDEYNKITYQEIANNSNFQSEISGFNSVLNRLNNYSIFKSIRPCISGYLIKQSYFKSIRNRIADFNSIQSNLPHQEFNEYDFIELRNLGSGSSSKVALYYHIQYEQLFAVKIPNKKNSKSIIREIKNYSQIQFPLLPKFYGKIKDLGYFVIEFITGDQLKNINNLSYDEKITILFQLMLTIEYLHRNNFVYRDLKPNNVIIDEYKNAILIDFDRMIKCDDKRSDNITTDFSSPFMGPEVNNGNYSKKSDIYSLGQMIYFLINEKMPPFQLVRIDDFKNNNELYQIHKKCVDLNDKNRPSISSLIFEFLIIFHSQIKIENLFKNCEIYFKEIYDSDTIDGLKDLGLNSNDPKYLNTIGYFYFTGKFISQDINKSIHYFTLAANKNFTKAQRNLGIIYYEGKYVNRDINKAIYYFTLAANQGDVESQYNLGIIYYDGKYIYKDINKVIKYFTLAANQNYINAQYNLGIIYSTGVHIKPDPQKAIHYLTLASQQSSIDAIYKLGEIFHFGQIVPRDIDKALIYYTQAADKDDLNAQIMLGLIYSEGEFVKRDINKAIDYLLLAANKNDLEAQFHLGLFYSNGKFLERDINKAIKYYTLSANQGYSRSQYNLGMLYYDGDYVSQDIEKAIKLFELAAYQNVLNAQFMLGVIYSKGKYVIKDMQKAIYYYKLAADQNHLDAQNSLAILYYRNKDVPVDIRKTIYYFTLAAKQNCVTAQFDLGRIYSTGIYIQVDIEKAIYFFQLAAKQNFNEAFNELGSIYYNGFYVPRDIEKAIFYYSKAANNLYTLSMFNLGLIYFNDKKDINKAIKYFDSAAQNNHIKSQLYLFKYYYINKNIKKAIYYLKLAVEQKSAEAQYMISFLYFKGIGLQRDIKKAIEYLILSKNQNYSDAELRYGILLFKGLFIKQDINNGINNIIKSASKGNSEACFIIGYLYHEGYYVIENINKSIKYYKIASSNNYFHSKNNLGVLYLNHNENIGISICYFEDAIKEEKDILAMYNLANIYLYKLQNKKNIDKAIDLLIELATKKFIPSFNLLCFALIKKYDINLYEIRKELNENKEISLIIECKINYLKLYDFVNFEKQFQWYENILYLYDALGNIISSVYMKNLNKNENTKNLYHPTDISDEFYKGFGLDLF